MVGKWLVLGLACAFPGCAGKSTTNGEQGTDCVSLCEKGRAECEGTEQLRCEDSCLGEDVRVEATGCRSQYEKMQDCTAELEDICAVRTDCKSELQTLLACYADYCIDHPSSAFCSTTT
jgi:hypothetical protein